MHNRQSTIVAAIQFAPKLLEVHENLGTAAQLAHEAAAKGAGVIVLPEMCVSGYTLQNPAGSSYKSSIQQIVYELLLGGLLVISGQNIFSGINGELRISETNI